MSFEATMEFTLSWEGGRSNDPDDPGGATNYGITQKTYDAFRFDSRSVAHITKDEVWRIYKTRYWDAAHCDELPDKLATVVMDTAVNCGVTRALKWLQTAVAATPDGVFGNASRTKLAAQLEHIGAEGICAEYITLRRKHYSKIITNNPKLAKFSRGWENRVKSLESFIA